MNTGKLSMIAAVAALVAGCAALSPRPDYDALTAEMMKTSFRDEGIAKIARLEQDASNAECSRAAGTPLPEARAKTIEAANLKTVKMPSDGTFIGDWKEGEKLAQNGRGMTWTDASASDNGGNCYNCHQISKAEISFGTIGPSLYNYGKLRGVERSGGAGVEGDRRIHLGQAVEREGVQRLLGNAALRPCRLARRDAVEAPDGAAARPEVTGQRQ